MSKLVWDQTGTREFQGGVSEVALFPMGSNGEYEKGVAWSGVTGISENPSGADITDLYADDIKYASLQSAERFAFGIEAYDYPDEWSECDGSKEVTPGVYIGQQTRKAFGLVYKTKIGDDTHPGMDKGYLIHIIYNCTATPSGRGYTTINENPDAITMSWDANSTPVNVEGYKATSSIVIDSTKCDKTKLTTLETKIYGGESSEPAMPLPAEVISTMKSTTTGGGSANPNNPNP
jgi:hypothetical protein